MKKSLKLGFSIGKDVFGYGLLIPHYGTIVVNATARIGNYSVLHTSTCVGGNGIKIGDGLYLSTGAKIMGGDITLGDAVSVAAGSLVKKSVGSNVLLAGMPAKEIKNDYLWWYERDGNSFANRVTMVETLKMKMKL